MLDPFLMKRRSPLDPVSSSTFIVLVLIISLLLASLEGPSGLLRCFLDLCRPFFFKFSHFFGLISSFCRLALCELPCFFPKILIIATTAVTLPVLEFSIAILLSLVIYWAILVALIRWVSVDSKLMPTGLTNLRCFFLCGCPVHWTNYSCHCHNHYPISQELASWQDSWILPS